MVRNTTDFAARVRGIVRRIPHGRPLAHRAVGNIMRETRDTSVPCHRVIAAGGRLGGYGRDLYAKRALLLQEGIIVSGSRIRNFAEIRWRKPRRQSS